MTKAVQATVTIGGVPKDRRKAWVVIPVPPAIIAEPIPAALERECKSIAIQSAKNLIDREELRGATIEKVRLRVIDAPKEAQA